jgi:hypothetical protein
VINRWPVARADVFMVGQGKTLTGNVRPNDDDGDGDALTAQVVSQPADGKLTFNADGTFTYTAPEDIWGFASSATSWTMALSQQHPLQCS